MAVKRQVQEKKPVAVIEDLKQTVSPEIEGRYITEERVIALISEALLNYNGLMRIKSGSLQVGALAQGSSGSMIEMLAISGGSSAIYLSSWSGDPLDNQLTAFIYQNLENTEITAAHGGYIQLIADLDIQYPIVKFDIEGIHLESGMDIFSSNGGTLVSVGDIKMTARATAPTGWLICDGASLLRVGTYATLFAAISTTFGSADADHFNIPDFRGRGPVGVGTGTGGGASGTGLPTGGSALTARALSAWFGAETVSIAHTHTGPSHTHGVSGSTGYYDLGTDEVQNGSGDSVASNTNANHRHGVDLTTGSGGTGNTGAMSDNATPGIVDPKQTVNFIIKY